LNQAAIGEHASDESSRSTASGSVAQSVLIREICVKDFAFFCGQKSAFIRVLSAVKKLSAPDF